MAGVQDMVSWETTAKFINDHLALRRDSVSYQNVMHDPSDMTSVSVFQLILQYSLLVVYKLTSAVGRGSSVYAYHVQWPFDARLAQRRSDIRAALVAPSARGPME